MKKYIDMFLESASVFLQKTEEALNSNDLHLISSQIHSMKPKFAMMGMKEAQPLALKIEKRISEGNTQNIKEDVRRLQVLCQTLGDALSSQIV